MGFSLNMFIVKVTDQFWQAAIIFKIAISVFSAAISRLSVCPHLLLVVHGGLQPVARCLLGRTCVVRVWCRNSKSSYSLSMTLVVVDPFSRLLAAPPNFFTFWTQCYKTFFVRKLRIFVISYSVCHWQALPT